MYNTIMDFANAVVDEIKIHSSSFFPSDFVISSVEINKVMKSNDTECVGIVIRKEGSNIAPNIYLETCYNDYINNGIDLYDICTGIANARMQHDAPDIDTDNLDNLDKMKDKILPRLVNAKLNAEYLANKPHKFIEDLAVMYIARLADDASMPITDSLLDRYGITTDELDKIAMDNLAKSEVEFKSMYDMMREMIPEDMWDELPPDDGMMHVLTNKSKVYGASAILDKSTMDKIVDKLGSGFAIIPSSVHEVIILKVVDNMDVNDLKSMIGTVNTEQLEAKDILSDHPYIYNKKSGLASV